MITDKAGEAREKWVKSGSIECEKHHFEKEVIQFATGDVYCTKCGMTCSKDNINNYPH